MPSRWPRSTWLTGRSCRTPTAYFSPTGESLAGLIVPPGVIPGSAIGVTLHWAYVVLDYPPAATFASNAVSLTIVP